MSNTNRSSEPSKLPTNAACQLIFSMRPGCKIYSTRLSSKPKLTNASFSYRTPPIYSKSKRHTFTTVKISCCYSIYRWPLPTPSSGCSSSIHFRCPSPKHTSYCPSRRNPSLPYRLEWSASPRTCPWSTCWTATRSTPRTSARSTES